jgi:ABC-type multidrug transport system, permease component
MFGQFKNKIHDNENAWKDFFYIIGKELYNIFTDKGVLIIFFIACLIYPLVVSFVYNKEMLRDMPMAAVDLSASSLSREYLRRVDATPEVHITKYCTSLAEAKELQRTSVVHGIILIPGDFADNINTEKQAHLDLFCDLTSFFYYRNAMLSNSTTSQLMGIEIQVQRRISKGEDIEAAKKSSMPFIPTEQVLFNPGGYPSFILPIIYILVLQQTLLIGIGMLGGTATEKNKHHALLPNNTRYSGLFRLIFGRSIAFFLTYLPIVIYALIVVPNIFNIPQLTPSPYFVLWFITPFLFATIFLGLTVASFFQNRENSIPVFLFMSIPFLLLSGLSWPREAMPNFWLLFSQLVPSTSAINGFVRMMTLGASAGDVSAEHFGLWLLAGFYFFTTYVAFSIRIYRDNKRIAKEEAQSQADKAIKATKA